MAAILRPPCGKADGEPDRCDRRTGLRSLASAWAVWIRCARLPFFFDLLGNNAEEILAERDGRASACACDHLDDVARPSLVWSAVWRCFSAGSRRCRSLPRRLLWCIGQSETIVDDWLMLTGRRGGRGFFEPISPPQHFDGTVRDETSLAFNVGLRARACLQTTRGNGRQACRRPSRGAIDWSLRGRSLSSLPRSILASAAAFLTMLERTDDGLRGLLLPARCLKLPEAAGSACAPIARRSDLQQGPSCRISRAVGVLPSCWGFRRIRLDCCWAGLACGRTGQGGHPHGDRLEKFTESVQREHHAVPARPRMAIGLGRVWFGYRRSAFGAAAGGRGC